MADDKPTEEIQPEETKEVPQEEPEKTKVEEPSPGESPQEQLKETPEEPKTPTEEPSAGEEGEEAPPQMSRRKAERLEKLEGLVERLKGPEMKPKAPTDGINYREMLDAEPEVYEQLEAKSQEFGQSQFDAGREQANTIQFHTRLEIDAPKIEAKYPQFDKDSVEFNPAVADAINKWYLATVGYNSQTNSVQNANVRYADFVEGIMELADNMAGVKTTKTASNIAKQAASTGLRPDGSSARGLDLGKAPEDMTDEELNAVISRDLPRDIRGRFIPQK